MMSNNDSIKDHSHYPKLDDNEVSKLLGDRIQFKLWSAKKHLDKLVKIENNYGGLMGTNRIYAEDELDCYFAQIMGARDALLMLINEKLDLKLSEEDVELGSINRKLKNKGKQKIIHKLNKLSSNTSSWFWILNEYRNKSIHRNILNKKAAVSISENINDKTSSSNVKNYLLSPPAYKDPMEKETIVFLSDCIEKMQKLIENIKKDAGI